MFATIDSTHDAKINVHGPEKGVMQCNVKAYEIYTMICYVTKESQIDAQCSICTNARDEIP